MHAGAYKQTRNRKKHPAAAKENQSLWPAIRFLMNKPQLFPLQRGGHIMYQREELPSLAACFNTPTYLLKNRKV